MTSITEPVHGESAWSALRVPMYRTLWISAVVSNIGTWMHNVGAAWLMTGLAPSPLWVSLVQTAISLPVFLLALPAGALADITDRRRLLLITQTAMSITAALIGLLTFAGLVTPAVLLLLTFLLGLGLALMVPAWQAVIPELVPRPLIQSAILLSGVSFNIAIAIGPALGGLIIARWTAGAVFLINAVSFVGVIVVLQRWQHERTVSDSPAERIVGATRAGIRYVRHAPEMHAVLARGAGFIIFAAAMWALLPLLARQELHLNAGGYGILQGCFGAGAVIGATILPPARRRLGGDVVVTLSTLAFAVVLTSLALVRSAPLLAATLVLGGIAWLWQVGTLMVITTTQVPLWIRARALATFFLVFNGGLAGGSFLWGAVAERVGMSNALLVTAGGLTGAAMLLLVPRFRLGRETAGDLTPSVHWPAPNVAGDLDPKDGPVVVLVEYIIDPSRAEKFVREARNLRRLRKRDGAIRWRLSRDVADPRRYVESYVVESWGEHLRQHQRFTVADREIEQRVRGFHTLAEAPRVTHLLSQRVPS